MARHERQLSFADGPLFAALAKSCPNLAEQVSKDATDFNSIRIQYRGVYDWLAVCKRWGEDGSPEVIFGSGPDFVGAILGLEAALDKGAWRPDKFATK